MKRRRATLSDILKNADLTNFQKRVYSVVGRIPAGKIRSYRWVACKAGRPNAYRAVGNILHRNPYIGIVPCHRVVCSDGSIGGFARGSAAKKRMLAAEGVDFGAKALL